MDIEVIDMISQQKVRKVGTSYVVTVTKSCRALGVGENEYVNVDISRIDDGGPGSQEQRMKRDRVVSALFE